MKKTTIKSAIIILFTVLSTLSFGQTKQIVLPNITSPFKSKKVISNQSIITPKYKENDTIKRSKLQIENVKGSFYVDLSKEKELSDNISKDFNKWFKLDKNHTFQLVSSKTDDLKITHNYFQQYYKGYLVEGSILMLHSKDGYVYAANGQIAEFSSIETQIGISKEDAVNVAKQFAKVTTLSKDYPVDTLICRIPTEKGFDFKFAYKIRIESSNPFVLSDLFVDTKTGRVINNINLINDIDTPATANTMYSGTQTITTDFSGGIYTLKDNARKIETYDATFASSTQDPTLFSNSTTNWSQSPFLNSFTINNVSQNWWYSAFGDTSPDLYVIVKDAANSIIYNGRNNYVNNTLPTSTNPIIFTLNILLTNQPYSIEIWDYDAVGGDDFGGSYTISSISGLWSVNSNSGIYNVLTAASNPALDIHWGMEKTYDFYKNIFNRNSFDNAGATIKNYYNPPSMQNGNKRNNAQAIPQTPINQSYMVYGSGDNSFMKQVVGVDVQGHEFTHLVVNSNGLGGLRYQGESGALNESFADIFGTCVEFYAKPSTANWTIGEDFVLPAPNYLRSLSNPNGPNSNLQPDTYNGQLWLNPNCGVPADLNDSCGVHRNSGVQNYWFYLLAQNTSTPTISSTNDLGNAFSVTSIGINHASRIAYRNLTTYIGGNDATFYNAYIGSLLATQDLFGNPSTEYTAVKNAWYAVGVGNDNPNLYCSGITNLTAQNGTITDGSNNASYNNNANCKWVIAPPGATQISLNFSSFDTEATYDIVNVYNGPDDTYPLLASWYGNTLPPTISTSAGVGAMCIKFTSDATTTNGGWSANYTSIISTPTCSGNTILTSPSGTFSDGSGVNNYTNNQKCFWYIAPPCATSVTLSFSSFNTELNHDGVIIYDSLNATNQLGVFSGTNLPASITSNTGAMLVVFISDYSTLSQGFTASYSSVGSSYCSGVTTLNTSDYGTISDGSGANNYCNNSNCTWLIQPPQATSISLKFTQLDLENSNSADGLPIYDAVEIYDGNSPIYDAGTPPAVTNLLGIITGNNIPTQTFTSTSGSMYIKFYSDVSVTKQGWSANYTSTQNSYCNSSTSTLTASSGTFSDGSGTDKYANNSNCTWLIQPPSASSVTLSFSTFDTELNFDGVIVYNGINTSASVLGQFSGTTIPSSVTSTGGSMYVVFQSDEALRSNGWNASYTSSTLGINGFGNNENIKPILYPNPTSSKVFFDNSNSNFKEVTIYNYLGQEVAKNSFMSITNNQDVDMSNLAMGVYVLKFSTGDTSKSVKVIKQ